MRHFSVAAELRSVCRIALQKCYLGSDVVFACQVSDQRAGLWKILDGRAKYLSLTDHLGGSE